MSGAREWLELSELWTETFGEDMPHGLMVGYAQMPLLRKCIEKKSTKPLDDWIARQVAKGRVY